MEMWIQSFSVDLSSKQIQQSSVGNAWVKVLTTMPLNDGLRFALYTF